MMGPVEYLIVEFPGNKFKGEIIPALKALTDDGIIRIIDLVFIRKDADGSVTYVELSNLPDDETAAFDTLDYEIDDLVNEEDIMLAAAKLAPNSSAGLLVFEHVWTARMRDAIVNANGRLVENGRIPAEIVEAALLAVAQ